VTQWILASDGHPFRDRDAAQIKRDLLVRELGAAVQLHVVPHPEGGFAVSVEQPQRARVVGRESVASLGIAEPSLAGEVSPRETLLRTLERTEPDTPSFSRLKGPLSRAPADSPNNTANSAPSSMESEHYAESFRLSPATRAFLSWHLQALLGAVLLFQPHLVFVVTRLGVPNNATAAALILAGIALCGALLAMLSLTRFLWTYTANTYVVDRNGVEQIQWYFEKGRLRRRAPRVNFAHLRSADVDQSILQMLLNVGSLKLAAGATDNYEVVLRHISAPRALQREFQRRLHQASDLTRRPRAGQDL
jgi:hypothetical protein